ncbi:hypothetical protein DFJ58DRAFT_490375 [Suillus subalutaceus]|uniref:uncharacterized protein n=1 Tax=Suillus subalutaceus TaxID=48586 RepID=UPI001B86CCA7|nr:uncharacterized protein DFJ58DRAFT_490375 [Suillus subalutaceus]KAG1846580.1 hypothetical protein DFJ58DRAFT_490375 [Suillus subalutaceus]
MLCPPNICTNSLTRNMSLMSPLPINLDLFPCHLAPQTPNYLAHQPRHTLSRTPLIHLNRLPPCLPRRPHLPHLLNTNVCDFVPGGRSISKVSIKIQDDIEATLDAPKKHSSQPPTVPTPPVVTNRWQPSVSVRIESEESKRAREENALKEPVVQPNSTLQL